MFGFAWQIWKEKKKKKKVWKMFEKVWCECVWSIFRWHQKDMGKGYSVLQTNQTIESHGQALSIVGASNIKILHCSL